MKVIDEGSIADFKSHNLRAMDVVNLLLLANKCKEFDDMADTVYAPNGMTREQWEKWLVDHRDYLLNKFVV